MSSLDKGIEIYLTIMKKEGKCLRYGKWL